MTAPPNAYSINMAVPSQVIAGVGIGDGCSEKAAADHEQDDIKHPSLLSPSDRDINPPAGIKIREHARGPVYINPI